MISLSTNVLTVDRISCWISVRPAVWASLAMVVPPGAGCVPVSPRLAYRARRSEGSHPVSVTPAGPGRLVGLPPHLVVIDAREKAMLLDELSGRQLAPARNRPQLRNLDTVAGHEIGAA